MSVQGAAAPVESAGSTGTSPRDAGGSRAASVCLDQFAPMLPSDPVQHLPLLPAAATTSATVRVAAWLLQQGHCCGAEAAGDDSLHANNTAGAGHLVGSDSEDDCGSVTAALGEEGSDADDPEELLASLAAEAAEAAAELVGDSGTAHKSLQGFMRQPVKHGDALNNYFDSLL